MSNRVALINKAKALIAPSTGLAWIAYSTNTPCIMISGSTEEWHEFPNPHRIINKDVCHGCIHNEKYEFNDKLDCPENKDYICSKTISSITVIEKLNKILWSEDVSIFNTKNEQDAKSIILTPENNTSTDERWEEETAIIKEILHENFDFKGKTVLDYGCGIGRLSKVVVDDSKEVDGLDISESMRTMALDYVNNEKFNTISTLGDKKYDIVICSWVLQHINNSTQVLEDIKNNLNDGGYLFVLNNEGVDAIPQNGWVLRKSSLKDELNSKFRMIKEFKNDAIDKVVSSFIGIYKTL